MASMLFGVVSYVFLSYFLQSAVLEARVHRYICLSHSILSVPLVPLSSQQVPLLPLSLAQPLRYVLESLVFSAYTLRQIVIDTG